MDLETALDDEIAKIEAKLAAFDPAVVLDDPMLGACFCTGQCKIDGEKVPGMCPSFAQAERLRNMPRAEALAEIREEREQGMRSQILWLQQRK